MPAIAHCIQGELSPSSLWRLPIPISLAPVSLPRTGSGSLTVSSSGTQASNPRRRDTRPRRPIRISNCVKIHNDGGQRHDRSSFPVESLETSSQHVDSNSLRTSLLRSLRQLIGEVGRKPLVSTWYELWKQSFQLCGDSGARQVLEHVTSHRIILDVEGSKAISFWNDVIQAASRDEDMLWKVASYADWLLKISRTTLPGLYMTVVSSFLESKQLELAVKWHDILRHRHDPGIEAFTALIKRFILDPADKMQSALKSMYSSSNHRRLYNAVLPHLFLHGESMRAIAWREVLLSHNDRVSPWDGISSQLFIRYLSALNFRLSEEEMTVNLLAKAVEPLPLMEGPPPNHSLIPRLFHRLKALKASQYNDTVIARWFATRWVPIDGVIALLHFFKTKRIGPHSLRAIALREPDIDRIAGRFLQLQQVGIELEDSTYVKAVQYLVDTRQHDLVADLAESDIHHEVLDDHNTVMKMIDCCVQSGDWRQYRLLLSIQLSMCRDLSSSALNQVLRSYADANDRRALVVVEDMWALGIQLSADNARRLFSSFVSRLKFNKLLSMTAQTYASAIGDARDLCRIASEMGILPAAQHWHILFTGLTKLNRQDELETLCLFIARLYEKLRIAGGLIHVNEEDFPPMCSLRIHAKNLEAVLPADLKTTDILHPLRRIFSRGVIRWLLNESFLRTISRPLPPQPSQYNRSTIADYDVARGFRLLRELSLHGISVDSLAIRHYMLDQLMAVQSSPRLNIHYSRGGKYLSLTYLRELYNEAWGSEILPIVSKLEAALASRSGRFSQRTELFPWRYSSKGTSFDRKVREDLNSFATSETGFGFGRKGN